MKIKMTHANYRVLSDRLQKIIEAKNESVDQTPKFIVPGEKQRENAAQSAQWKQRREESRVSCARCPLLIFPNRTGLCLSCLYKAGGPRARVQCIECGKPTKIRKSKLCDHCYIRPCDSGCGRPVRIDDGPTCIFCMLEWKERGKPCIGTRKDKCGKNERVRKPGERCPECKELESWYVSQEKRKRTAEAIEKTGKEYVQKHAIAGIRKSFPRERIVYAKGKHEKVPAKDPKQRNDARPITGDRQSDHSRGKDQGVSKATVRRKGIPR